MVNEKEFYREKFVTAHPWKWYYDFFLPFHLSMYKTYWIKRMLKPGAKVLDLGCGGGRAYFARKFEMYGLDISEPAVMNAKGLYKDAVVSDVRTMPFPDASFDFVMSMDLLGHIPLEDKNSVISEIKRVLKPGGSTIHYVETESSDNNIKENFPVLYYQSFILQDGHFGLELPTETVSRFARYFKIIKTQGHAAILSPIEDYAKRFSNEMSNASRRIRFLTTISQMIAGHTYMCFLVNCLLGIPARILNSLAPLDHSRGIFIAAQKGAR